MSARYAAIDLGASSGRVMVGEVRAEGVQLQEVHRFANGPMQQSDGLHWNINALWHECLMGLREASAQGPLTSIGIDSWAIDHAFVDRTGALLADPWHHRDPRTNTMAERLSADISAAELYRINGLQHLPFTTVYQLMASADSTAMQRAERMLLIPDLLVRWLTGVEGAERTNASTTGLLDVTTGQWSSRVCDAAGLRSDLLPAVCEPGSVAGPLLDRVRDEVGCDSNTLVTRVGSHDTASAVVGVPGEGKAWAYIACGTWALAGVELERPVLTDDSRAANFTNEVGVDGTIRYLRNVMGLWVLSESLRTWAERGEPHDLDVLLVAAGQLPAGGPVVPIDDPSLLTPGDMPARVAELCRASDQPVPVNPAAMVRCILDSLAVAFARAIDDAERLSGQRVDVIHLVGGGSRNHLLCHLTARAAGRVVLAGPVEATALGNVLVQARAHGDIQGGLSEMRDVVRHSAQLTRFEP